ncbi:MAG: cytidine deaminase [Candidatus Competibacteraceae bacterium]|nr:cytidine deaminase [Candidatus Competibacteraceae bacterium]
MSKIHEIPTGCTMHKRDELNVEDASLMQAALNVALKAYAPYSRFKVGAALLLENGEIVSASNQENAAYPSGLCAERVALFFAGSTYPGVAVKKIAISIDSEEKDLTLAYAPCGSCRQVIAETEKRQNNPMQILFEGPHNQVICCEGIDPLLPFAFRLPE